MNEEYEMEELADLAIEELREFIDTEKQLVQEEHEFLSKLQSCDYIIGHLDERIPDNMTYLHELNRNTAEKLVEIRELIESGTLNELRVLKEEEQILQQLRGNVEHRNWRAVRKNIDLQTREEEQIVRLEKRELRDLHSKFIDLMKLMKRSKLKSAMEENLTIKKEKDEYEKLEEYYFLQLYKFVRAYERIFRHLWRKDLVLSKKIRRDSKRIS
ncbi:MAG: hypothetical protein AABX33_06600 [Nanoarchaeota archaeon]